MFQLFKNPQQKAEIQARSNQKGPVSLECTGPLDQLVPLAFTVLLRVLRLALQSRTMSLEHARQFLELSHRDLLQALQAEFGGDHDQS